MADFTPIHSKPFLTVFTPTYNRAYSLVDVYKCLCEQSLQDFEWVIVDDGSSDNTEQLVQTWRNEQRLNIKYTKKNNGGKHTAINLGLQLAQGEWFLIFDSDDKCTPNTVERFYTFSRQLSSAELARVSTISVRSVTESGADVGPRYGFKQKIVVPPAEQLKLRSQAERWGINKTALMQEIPFPEYAGERFVPESLIWNRLSLHYATYFIDEALRIFTPREDGLTASMLKIRVNSPKGTALVYREMGLLDLGTRMALKAQINYYRFDLHAGKFKPSQLINPLYWIGVALMVSDILRLKFGD